MEELRFTVDTSSLWSIYFIFNINFAYGLRGSSLVNIISPALLLESNGKSLVIINIAHIKGLFHSVHVPLSPV